MKSKKLWSLGVGLAAATVMGTASAGSIVLPGVALPNGAPALLPDVTLGGGGNLLQSLPGLQGVPGLGTVLTALGGSTSGGSLGPLNDVLNTLTGLGQSNPLFSALNTALSNPALTPVVSQIPLPLAGLLNGSLVSGFLAGGQLGDLLALNAPNLSGPYSLSITGGLGGTSASGNYLFKPTVIDTSLLKSDLVLASPALGTLSVANLPLLGALPVNGLFAGLPALPILPLPSTSSLGL